MSAKTAMRPPSSSTSPRCTERMAAIKVSEASPADDGTIGRRRPSLRRDSRHRGTRQGAPAGGERGVSLMANHARCSRVFEKDRHPRPQTTLPAYRNAPGP